ncbi:hypothetical protein Taro_046958 [Colocasia esculenta]|uniref:RNase H type-1 domain-containing protein n=1 Tax=Colocasia esculenta TaxID=4460 RepID=A0A843WRG5_COLES|nr:hypothetical protein [Colocasia esculenta]
MAEARAIHDGLRLAMERHLKVSVLYSDSAILVWAITLRQLPHWDVIPWWRGICSMLEILKPAIVHSFREGNQMTRQMRKSVGPIASGGHASLPGSSPLLCGVERENSSWAATDFMPEIDDNESSSDCLFLEIAVTDDGASVFAELRVSTKQYSFAPVGPYIPMPAKEYSAMESTPAGDQAMLRVTMVVGKENIARLECELDEERTSLNQEARDEAKDSEEEAAYVRDGRNLRQLTTSKAKALNGWWSDCGMGGDVAVEWVVMWLWNWW